MSFWSKIGDTFKKIGKGVADLIPGFAISTASNAIGGAMSAKDAKRQHEYDLEKMAKQHGYNIESQKLGQQFNKEMWNYTNYENQKRHLENAGLNPALLYGMSGGGGATAAGAQGMGAGIASGHEMGIKQQGRGMGLQAAAIASQIDLNNSQAEKNRADAKKTAGVDTQLTEAQTDYTNSLKRLTDTKENTEAANYYLILQKQSLVFEQARNLAIKNDIDEATKQTQIDKVFQDFYLGQITAIEKITNIELTEQQIQKIGKEIEWYAFEAITKRMSAEAMNEMAKAATERVKNDLELGGRKLDIEEERLLKDWIYGGIQELCRVTETATDVAGIFGKAAKKIGKKVFEEVFDNKGKSKGWKERVEKDILE